MKDIVLVIFNPEIDSASLISKIKMLGPTFSFWENHWLIKTELPAKDVYEKIAQDEYQMASIIVFKFDHSHMNYYGRMITSLWQWLKDE